MNDPVHLHAEIQAPLSYSFSIEQLPAVVPHFGSLWGAGIFSRDFTTNLTPQCRAFSWASKTEKLNALLFPGPRGAVDTNDLCIRTISVFKA